MGSTGWTDWNLILDTEGGPNHVNNKCDANIIADPQRKVGKNTVILQASYYYMGHFSKFIPPGSKRIGVTSSVKVAGKVTAAQVEHKYVQFTPCSDNGGQVWHYSPQHKTLS